MSIPTTLWYCVSTYLKEVHLFSSTWQLHTLLLPMKAARMYLGFSQSCEQRCENFMTRLYLVSLIVQLINKAFVWLSLFKFQSNKHNCHAWTTVALFDPCKESQLRNFNNSWHFPVYCSHHCEFQPQWVSLSTFRSSVGFWGPIGRKNPKKSF